MSNEETNLEKRQDHIENTLTDVVRIVGNIERTVIAGFKNQGDRIDNLETELKSEISELRSDFSRLDSKVTVLTTDVNTLKSDISELKYDVGSMKQDISVMKTDISETKTDISELKSLMLKVVDKILV